MNGVEPVAFLPALRMPAMVPAVAPPQAPWDGGDLVSAAAAAPSDGAFSRIFVEQAAALNGKLLSADRGLQQLASGASANLHQLMMRLEDAKLSLQLALQVRNRLLDAYSELMRMPI